MSCNARSDYIRTDSTDICADHAWADGTEHTDVRRLATSVTIRAQLRHSARGPRLCASKTDCALNRSAGLAPTCMVRPQYRMLCVLQCRVCYAMLTDRSRLRLQAHRYADTDAPRRAGRRCTLCGTECAEYPILYVLEGPKAADVLCGTECCSRVPHTVRTGGA